MGSVISFGKYETAFAQDETKLNADFDRVLERVGVPGQAEACDNLAPVVTRPTRAAIHGRARCPTV